MSKAVIVKSKCDEDCDIIHKAQKKEFKDPNLQALANELEKKYEKMQDNMLAEIFSLLNIPRDELKKGLGGHKYVKRTGSPGNYKYWYKLPNGKLVSGDNAPEGHPHHDPEGGESGPKTVKQVVVKNLEINAKDHNKKIAEEDSESVEKQRENWDLERDGIDSFPMAIEEVLDSWVGMADTGEMFSDEEMGEMEELGVDPGINYGDMKRFQRGESSGSKAKDKLIQKYVNVLDKNFDKLHTYKGSIFRGIQIENVDKFITNLKVGSPIVPDSYSSFSKDEKTARAFGNIILKVDSNTKGKDLDYFTRLGEEEVLVKDGTQYQVSKIDTNGINPIITMTEVQPEKNSVSKKQVTVKSNKKTIVVKDAARKMDFDEKRMNYWQAFKTPKGGEYKPRHPEVNLVNYTKFGLAKDDQIVKLNSALNDAETILNSAGIKFKRGILFFAGRMDSSMKTNADYRPEESHQIGFHSGRTIEKSLMHEIGHAIDFSVSKTEGFQDSHFDLAKKNTLTPVSDNMPKSEDLSLTKQIAREVHSSPFYQEALDEYQAPTSNKESEKRYKYLSSPSEMFARAFEVWSFERATKLEKEGKINAGFTKEFFPDIYNKVTDPEQFKSIRKISDLVDQFLKQNPIRKSLEWRK